MLEEESFIIKLKRIGIGDTLNKVVNVINPIYFNDVYEAQATTRFTIE